jgi:Flp pilus assembly protein TadG
MDALQHKLHAIFHLIGRFRSDRRGNIAVIFTLACLPLISAIGCAIDYSRAAQIRSKLQASADAATVGSIARNSPAYLAAGSMSSDGQIPAGVTDATNLFNGNMSGVAGYTLNSLTPTVTRSNGAVTATVNFSASIPTVFLGVIGKSTMTVGGTSKATGGMPIYRDFYLLLDNSPSMAVGATPADVATLVNATSAPSFGGNRNCAFACHDTAPGATDNFYALAKSLGVTMRIDVLRSATQQLMSTAAQAATYSNQFRMAIYDFGATDSTSGLRTIFPLSSSLSAAQSAASNIDVMAVNGQNSSHDQDTPFEAILTQMNSAISAPGSGSSSAPQKYLFFVTDGVGDEANASCAYPFTNPTPRCISPINTALCTTMKNRGIKIAVLYTTYLNLPSDSFYNTKVAPFNAGPYGPSPNSQIALNLESCASPDLYFEVSPTGGIAEAMQALFQKAISGSPRISN